MCLLCCSHHVTQSKQALIAHELKLDFRSVSVLLFKVPVVHRYKAQTTHPYIDAGVILKKIYSCVIEAALICNISATRLTKDAVQYAKTQFKDNVHFKVTFLCAVPRIPILNSLNSLTLLLAWTQVKHNL